MGSRNRLKLSGIEKKSIRQRRDLEREKESGGSLLTPSPCRSPSLSSSFSLYLSLSFSLDPSFSLFVCDCLSSFLTRTHTHTHEFIHSYLIMFKGSYIVVNYYGNRILTLKQVTRVMVMPLRWRRQHHRHSLVEWDANICTIARALNLGSHGCDRLCLSFRD